MNLESLVIKATDGRLPRLERRLYLNQLSQKISGGFPDSDSLGNGMLELLKLLKRRDAQLTQAVTFIFLEMCYNESGHLYLGFEWNDVSDDKREQIFELLVEILEEEELSYSQRQSICALIAVAGQSQFEVSEDKLVEWLSAPSDALKFNVLAVLSAEIYFSCLFSKKTKIKKVAQSFLVRNDEPYLQAVAVRILARFAYESKKEMEYIQVIFPVVSAFKDDYALAWCIEGLVVLFSCAHASKYFPSIIEYLLGLARSEATSPFVLRAVIDSMFMISHGEAPSHYLPHVQSIVAAMLAACAREEDSPAWITCEDQFAPDDQAGLLVIDACDALYALVAKMSEDQVLYHIWPILLPVWNTWLLSDRWQCR